MNSGIDNRTLLMIDDSADDYHTTVVSLRKAGISNPLFWCESGDAGLDYLNRRGEYADLAGTPLPGLILLDINMPGTNGKEVLREIKTDEDLCRVPVIMLTTSDDERGVDECYVAGANRYITKPVGFAEFIEALTRLRSFWFEVAIHPRPIAK